MRVFTPSEIAPAHAPNKYLGVLIAARYARLLNEATLGRSQKGDKKLTTKALEELSGGGIEYRVIPRRRAAE